VAGNYRATALNAVAPSRIAEQYSRRSAGVEAGSKHVRRSLQIRWSQQGSKRPSRQATDTHRDTNKPGYRRISGERRTG
jgi:hypothetical protein